ncbi:MAG: ATP-binding protein [Alphaproteobacteria bacterium]
MVEPDTPEIAARSRVSPLSLLFSLGLFVLLMSLLLGMEAWKTQRAQLGFGSGMARNYARIFSEHAVRSIEGVSITLKEIANSLHIEKKWWEGDSLELHTLLRGKKLNGLPHVRDIILFDGDGLQRARSMVHPAASFTVNDRDYFVRHRNQGEDLIISHPFFGRNTKTWTFAISRRLTDLDNVFSGVVFASIEPRYFQDFYGVTEVLPGVQVALMQKDGTILASWPSQMADGTSHIGQSLASLPLFAPLREAGTMAPGAEAIIDGTIFAFKELDEYSLRVAVAVPSAVVLEDWRRHLRNLVLAAGLVFLVLVVAVVMAMRHMRSEVRTAVALREAADKFAALATCSGEWFWETDADGRVTYLSDRFEEVIGCPRAYLLGQTREELLDPTATSSDLTLVQGAIASRQPFRNMEWPLRLADGSTRWVRSSGIPHLDGEGRLLGYRGTATDITAQRAMATHDLQRQRVEALGQLAGGIAHELNNLLHPIINFAYFARHRVSDDPTARKYLDNVCDSGIRAREIVRGVLTFARHEHQERRHMVFSQALQHALDLAVGGLPASLRVERAIEESSDLALVSETEVAQIVVNLLTNARDATDGDGVVTVTLRGIDLAVETEIGESRLSPGCYLRLEVADNGCGMDEATRSRVFDPFFTTKPPGAGTGLGLSVVYGIVQSWRGAIEVDTRPGEGTTFRIHVPVFLE